MALQFRCGEHRWSQCRCGSMQDSCKGSRTWALATGQGLPIWSRIQTQNRPILQTCFVMPAWKCIVPVNSDSAMLCHDALPAKPHVACPVARANRNRWYLGSRRVRSCRWGGYISCLSNNIWNENEAKHSLCLSLFSVAWPLERLSKCSRVVWSWILDFRYDMIWWNSMKYYEICLGNQSEQTATQYQVNSDLHSVTGWKFDKDLCSQCSSRDKALHLAESLSWHRAFLDLKLCTHWIKRVKRVKRVSFLRFFKDTLLQSQVSWFFIPGLLAIWWTGMVQPAAKVSVNGHAWQIVADSLYNVKAVHAKLKRRGAFWPGQDWAQQERWWAWTSSCKVMCNCTTLMYKSKVVRLKWC